MNSLLLATEGVTEGATDALSHIKNFFTGNIFNIILFLAVLIIGFLVILIAMKIIRKLFNRSKLDKTITSILCMVIKFVLIFIYLMILCSIVGIPISSLLAIFTALSLAIGLAVQSSLSNVANGMVIIGSKPFKLDDYVSIDGTEGTVLEIKAISTKLKTPSGEIVSVPHSKTINSIIKNYNTTPERRLDITVSVEYGSDIEKVKEVLTGVIEAQATKLPDTDVTVRLTKCSDSSLDFVTRFWVLNEDYWNTYFDVNEQYVKALNDNGIGIPYNTIDVNIKK